MVIEKHTIDFIPEKERHGRVMDQGPFWFLSNFHFFTIAIGFIGPTLGLSLVWTGVAAAVGLLIGTTFQAFHASQGPELGLPQMIQSRAQFGYRGVVVPLVATLISLVGYNVVAAVLTSEGLHGLWKVDRTAAAVGVSLLAAALAIWGYDWLHRAFRCLFWISLPLFSILTLAILSGHAGGAPHGAGRFQGPAFLTELASAASYNITAAPYVSDYSRYLPARTSRRAIIANVFLGSALSAFWLILIGAWLATRIGTSDGLVALRQAGDAVVNGLGGVLAGVSIAALVATIGMNAYSAALTFATIADSLRPIRPARSFRIAVIVVLTVVWVALTAVFGGDAITYVNSMLVIMLYFLTPWTAVNLIDYFVLRRGRYAILDLFRPDGLYGAWGGRGLAAYGLGLLASLPFFAAPKLYVGPIASRLGGIDIGWLVSLAGSSLAYLLLSRGFNRSRETSVVAASDAAVDAPAPAA